MSVSRKYFVDVLVELSQEFVRKNLYPTNVCFLLEEAHCYAEEDTMEVCLEFISTCPKAVMESESFLRLCPECLIRITKSDEMSVAESTVYSSAMKWAEEECGRKNIQNTSENKRTVLGNIFDTIRFPIMDMNFFLDNVCVDKILTNDEVINILMFMRGNENGFDTTFNKNKRRFKHIYNNPAFGNVFGSGPSFILATSIGHGLFNN